MRVIRILAFYALPLAPALAQTWAQPVREVEKEASSAIVGSCQTFWSTTEGGASCTAYNVPAGKRLAIRHVSARCYGRSGDSFSMVNLYTNDPTTGTPYESYTHLQATMNSLAQFPVERAGSTQVFQHAQSGSAVLFFVKFNGNPTVTQSPACIMRFSGFLVNQ